MHIPVLQLATSSYWRIKIVRRFLSLMNTEERDLFKGVQLLRQVDPPHTVHVPHNVIAILDCEIFVSPATKTFGQTLKTSLHVYKH